MPNLRRSLSTYQGCTPEGVSGGSEAQMRFFVADAKADIATLSSALFEAKEALSYAMRGTADADQSDKYAATIARITAALETAGA